MAAAGTVRALLPGWRLMVEATVEALSCWTLSGAMATGLEPSVSDELVGLDADPDTVLAPTVGLEAEVEAIVSSSDALEARAGTGAEASDPDGLEPLLPDPAVSAGEDKDVPAASATGQTVVYTAMTSVVMDPTLAGQSVTVAAHEVIV